RLRGGGLLVGWAPPNFHAKALAFQLELRQTVLGNQTDQVAQLAHVNRLLEMSWHIPLAPSMAIASSALVAFGVRRDNVRLFFLIGHGRFRSRGHRTSDRFCGSCAIRFAASSIKIATENLSKAPSRPESRTGPDQIKLFLARAFAFCLR